MTLGDHKESGPAGPATIGGTGTSTGMGIGPKPTPIESQLPSSPSPQVGHSTHVGPLPPAIVIHKDATSINLYSQAKRFHDMFNGEPMHDTIAGQRAELGAALKAYEKAHE